MCKSMSSNPMLADQGEWDRTGRLASSDITGYILRMTWRTCLLSMHIYPGSVHASDI